MTYVTATAQWQLAQVHARSPYLIITWFLGTGVVCVRLAWRHRNSAALMECRMRVRVGRAVETSIYLRFQISIRSQLTQPFISTDLPVRVLSSKPDRTMQAFSNSSSFYYLTGQRNTAIYFLCVVVHRSQFLHSMASGGVIIIET
jgi:hypothetical protein